MRRSVINKSSVMFIVATLLFTLLTQLTFAQSSVFSTIPLIRTGDSIGTDGGRFIGATMGLHGLNDFGELGLQLTGAGCGNAAFILSETRTLELTESCKDTGLGKLVLDAPVNINDRGDLVFQAHRTDAPFFGKRVLALYLGGQLTKILTQGDVISSSGVFGGCSSTEMNINNHGDVAFMACAISGGNFPEFDLYALSGGLLRKAVSDGQVIPLGQIALGAYAVWPVFINDKNEILFNADLITSPVQKPRSGLFLATPDGIKKVVLDGDPLPVSKIKRETSMIGNLNNKGEVVFLASLRNRQIDRGIFVLSESKFSKVMVLGDDSPLGGTFSGIPPQEPEGRPSINDNGVVAFSAFVKGGTSDLGIFLSLGNAIVKVVALGDRLPTGEAIYRITSYALNNHGQVAFSAFLVDDNGTKSSGVFLCNPIKPSISSIKLKRRSQGLELQVNGSGLIINDTIIEINGMPLERMIYPKEFHEDGGLTTRVVSKDVRIEGLIPIGEPVEVRVLNRITGRRSEPVVLNRESM